MRKFLTVQAADTGLKQAVDLDDMVTFREVAGIDAVNVEVVYRYTDAANCEHKASIITAASYIDVRNAFINATYL